MQQIFEVLFGNVRRYLDILGRFGPNISALTVSYEDGFVPD